MYVSLCLVLLISLGSTPSDAARILAYFPLPSISHQVVFRPITQELAKRGHEVIIITTDPVFEKNKTPPNLTEIDVHDLSYDIWKETVMKQSTGDIDVMADHLKTILYSVVTVVDAQLQNEEVKKILEDKNQKFDLVLTEACARTSLIVSHIFNAPAIQVSSFGAVLDNYVSMGVPSHPFLYPEIIQPKLNDLTVLDKLTQVITIYFLEIMQQDLKKLEDNMLKKHFGNDTPTINELYKNIHMLFLNVHPIFEGIRPVPPSVIFMGGLHQNPEKELPTDLKTYLDSSKHGVIYLSFGTNVDPALLPPEKIQILIQTFSKLKYDVLWKWSKDELPGRSNNIKIFKWLPQSDLLRHPKIKLFVTQGGLQSTDEAITAGVPLIGVPMLGDQWFVVERYVTHKIGINLDLGTITEEKFTEAINSVIEDDSYRQNIVRLREKILDQPMKPLDRAVWWTEYVLRHGGAKHLQSPAVGITWSQYLELDLIALVLGLLLAAAIAVILIASFIYKVIIKSFIIKVKTA